MDSELSFSIIVPTYDRPAALRACVRSLLALDFPAARYEILVVDDGSPALPSFERPAGGPRLELFRRRHRGPAAARNHGAGQARGTHLAFIDDDCRAEPDWLRVLEGRFRTSPAAMLGGHTLNELADSVFSATSQQIIDYLYGYFHEPPRQGRFLTSNNLALPRKRFVELGGFDDRFTRAGAEDRELCDRWLRRGWEMDYVAAARVRHAHRLDLVGFLRQHFRYGQGNRRFHQLRDKLHLPSERYQPPGFYLGLLAHPLRRERAPKAWLGVGLTAAAQLSTAAGFFWEGVRPEEAR